MISKKAAAAIIDHTILKANATQDEIAVLCNEAKTYGFASVCVNPSHVPFAVSALKDSNVSVCTVIGFPLGATSTESKAFETEVAVKMGATEVDMVINVGALKSGNTELVKSDICSVVQAAKRIDPNTIVKVIIETSLLTDTEIVEVCQILLHTGADFVKTSTGFSSGGATVEDIQLMKSVVKNEMKIKASGGIKTYGDLCNMVDAGADRVGASSSVAIVS